MSTGAKGKRKTGQGKLKRVIKVWKREEKGGISIHMRFTCVRVY